MPSDSTDPLPEIHHLCRLLSDLQDTYSPAEIQGLLPLDPERRQRSEELRGLVPALMRRSALQSMRLLEQEPEQALRAMESLRAGVRRLHQLVELEAVLDQHELHRGLRTLRAHLQRQHPTASPLLRRRMEELVGPEVALWSEGVEEAGADLH